MLASLLALGALLVALVVGLGRQVTVFSAFEPGLWLFRAYRKKRIVGLVLVVALSTAAILMQPTPAVIALVGAAGLSQPSPSSSTSSTYFPLCMLCGWRPLRRAKRWGAPGLPA